MTFAQPKRILLVDDDAVGTELARAALAVDGYLVKTDTISNLIGELRQSLDFLPRREVHQEA